LLANAILLGYYITAYINNISYFANFVVLDYEE